MTTPGLIPKWSWFLTQCCAIDNSRKTERAELLIKRWMGRECNIHTQWDFIQPQEINEITDSCHYYTGKKTGFLTFPFILPGWLQGTVFIIFTDLKSSFISTQPLFLLCVPGTSFFLLGEEDSAFYTVILGHIRSCQDWIFFISVSWVFRIAPGPHQPALKRIKECERNRTLHKDMGARSLSPGCSRCLQSPAAPCV